jgi:hypothetical protein
LSVAYNQENFQLIEIEIELRADWDMSQEIAGLTPSLPRGSQIAAELRKNILIQLT